MALKKRKRTAFGKMAMGKDDLKISFEQAIDLVDFDKSVEGVRPRTLKGYKNTLHLTIESIRKGPAI